MAGRMVKPKRIGHSSGVPSRDSIPRICDTRIEMVTTSWYTVPT